jgi:hypothetical protein
VGKKKKALRVFEEAAVSQLADQLRIRRAAQRLLAQEDADAAFVTPASEWSLKHEIAKGIPALEYTIARLHTRGSNTVIAAQYKAGKTTLMANLVQAYADGVPFLGEFAMNPGPGGIAYLNYELTVAQFHQEYMVPLKIANPDRVHPLHLRGTSFDLRSPAAFAWAVQWLRERKCSAAIIDPYGAASRLKNENDNSEARLWLADCVDKLKAESGVADVFIPAHTGRGWAEEGQEHVRGASALDDWADNRWVYTIQQEKEGERTLPRRYLMGHGRGVDVPEFSVDFEKSDKSLWFGGAQNRASVRRTSGISEVVRVVKATPGINTTELRAGMNYDGSKRQMAINQAIADGLVRVEEAGKAKRHYLVEQ